MSRADRTAVTSGDLDRLTGSLTTEFAGVFGRGEIEPVVAESSRLLADVRSGEVAAWEVEGFARDRLLALGRVRGSLVTGRPAVIFVCVHNAGRSQISAGWANHLGKGRVTVFSGGSAPGDVVNPGAVTAMAEAGVDISRSFPKPFTDEIVRASDVVVTMGCGDACPFFPEKRYLDWDLPDPHDASLDQIRILRDEIRDRVRVLLAELGID